jgi:hypothetical protein
MSVSPHHGESPMKTALLGLISSVILASVLYAQAPKAAPALPPGSEVGQAEILKVYSMDDGDAKFRAYGIKYKGNDVVVSETLGRTNYKVGESINFLVTRSKSGAMLFQSYSFMDKKK